ncbi:hypothetical protein B566_EDAN004985 [Ephemera danica]|nr:hypothetical protein B566_EDAN004985 [Ephemera danica]
MADIENVSGSITIPEDAIDSTPLTFKSILQSPSTVSVTAAKEWAQRRRQTIRPWADFLNAGRFRAPASVPRLSRRLVRNVDHFQSNYLLVFIGLAIFCLLTSPLLLIAVAGSLIGCHFLATKQAERTLTIMGRELSLAQQYAMVAIASLPIFLWAGAGAAVFWVMGASCFFITLHAAFYNIEALLSPEDENFDLVMEEV